MEFLRFGSSIPGAYWGCCAGDIIQNFNYDPDAKASIQIVEGDSGTPMMNDKRELLFAGPTYRDIFWQRLRFGTFSKRDMPNHFFLVVLSHNQIISRYGQKWLVILKEAGFEFIRNVNNSVWNVNNYVFGLFRGINDSAPKNPYRPPAQWTSIQGGSPSFLDYTSEKDLLELTKRQREFNQEVWDRIGPAKLLTEAELIEAKAPVVMAGKRSRYPQQTKQAREQLEKDDKNIAQKGRGGTTPGPFAAITC